MLASWQGCCCGFCSQERAVLEELADIPDEEVRATCIEAWQNAHNSVGSLARPHRLRNVWAQRRRNSLVGLAVMVSALLLLLSDATMNGVARQVLRGYLNLQSGHVAVVWSEMKTVKLNDAARFLPKLKSFGPAQKEDNQQATLRLKQFLADSSSEVAAFFPAVRRSVQTKVRDNINRSIAYDLTEANRQHLLKTGTIRMAVDIPSPSARRVPRHKG